MIENQTIKQVDFVEKSLQESYTNCLFIECNFANLAIDEIEFEKCVFESCNFSLTRFKEVLRDVTFRDCKMIGADFSEIMRFSSGFSFDNCHLNYACFVGTKMRKSLFTNCTLHETFFDKSDLMATLFDRCDLTRSTFHEANLEKVDFSSSFGYSINPTTCTLKKTIFSETELKGLVEHLNIIIKPTN